MNSASLDAFGAIAFTFGRHGVGTLASLGELMACFDATCILFIFFVVGSIAKLHDFSIWSFLKDLKEESLIELGTSSSEVALPPPIAKLETLGAHKSVVGLVVPTGYCFNPDGTAIYLPMATIFIGQATNTRLSLGRQLFLPGGAGC